MRAFTWALLACARAEDLHSVLMITVDDLRTQFNGSYAMSGMSTPNLDVLAKDGTTFHRAYCQQAVCSPSRNSFMSGRRPDTTKVWNFIDHFRQDGVGAQWTTLPQYFKQHGFLTYGSGKHYHPAHPPNNDFPASWTVDEHNSYYWGNSLPIGDTCPCKANPKCVPPSQTCPCLGNVTLPLEAWSAAEVCQYVDDDAALDDDDEKDTPQGKQLVDYDHRVATRAIENLEHAVAARSHFFVAAGFRRPHLDWRTPRRFWELYGGEIELAKHQTIGHNITRLAFELNGPLGGSFTDPDGSGRTHRASADGPPLPAPLQRSLRRAYYASVSFMDFEVGRLLRALERLDLASSTAVLFFGDHGWKLGEHGAWSKCSNWEMDVRVPMIIRAPWLGPASIGASTLAFAELVDIYPTLTELAGLPPVPPAEGIEGTSLVPVLLDPDADAPHAKTAAFSQYPRCPQFNISVDPMGWECLEVPREQFGVMGYSVRVADARYTEWRTWKPTCEAEWGEAGLQAVELYDHTGDVGAGSESFDGFEFENHAYEPARAAQVAKLAAVIRSHFDHGGPLC